MIPFTLRSALAAYFYSQGLSVGISCKCRLTGITVLLKMLVFHKKKLLLVICLRSCGKLKF